jgi:hypothetical protein
MCKEMKTLPPLHASRRRWIAKLLLFSASAVCAGPAEEAPAAAKETERSPRKGAMGIVIIAQIESLAPLDATESAESGRRIELNLSVESHLGLSDEKKKLRLRCNGLARIFGAKNEEIRGKVFLFRLLEELADPYDGKFEVWAIQGGHP